MLTETGRSLLIIFCLIVLIGNAVVSYRSTRSIIDANAMVLHSEEVLFELKSIITAMKEAESGQRGYLITSDDRFLERYDQSSAMSLEHIDRLRELLADNPTQLSKLPALEQSVNARLETLKANLDLQKTRGLEAVRNVGMLERGRQEMAAVRDNVGKLEEGEKRLLSERVSQAESDGRRTLVTFVFANLLVLALLGFVYYLIKRDIAQRVSAEGDLRAANDQLESRVKERTSELEDANVELERSNRELQDFAFVASHDLQEPLRKIQAFGDRLKIKQGEQLGEDGRNYLERMQNAAGRMQTLINDLLTFSRVTTKAQPFVSVDLNRIAKEVVSDLETRIQQVGGSVLIGRLPSIEADPLQMRQLLQNLIGNALKFHRTDVPPIVKVEDGGHAEQGRRARGANCRITVQDNGIGFDEKYLDRIFTPFQRLHARGEYEGTGIGLAVCRKIVERHGGSITAKSQPGTGTTFELTLPVRQNEGDSNG